MTAQPHSSQPAVRVRDRAELHRGLSVAPSSVDFITEPSAATHEVVAQVSDRRPAVDDLVWCARELGLIIGSKRLASLLLKYERLGWIGDGSVTGPGQGDGVGDVDAT